MYEQQFKLGAQGKAFDVDGYLSTVRFSASKTWHVGDLLSGDRKIDTNGFFVTLGTSSRLNLRDQQEVATEFLVNHRDELHENNGRFEIEQFFLMLQLNAEVDRCTTGFYVQVSRQLLSLTLPLKIDVLTYVA